MSVDTVTRMWGEVLTTEDMTGGLRVNQEVIPLTGNKILRAVRIGLILFGDPTFDEIALRIYSTRNGAPGKLLHESTNVRTKAQIQETFPEPYVFVETYFEFDYLRLRKDEPYRFVLYSPGYVMSDMSHIAWKKGYPDPIYRTGVNTTQFSMGTNPYHIAFIAGDL